jgi:hypothetical protein
MRASSRPARRSSPRSSIGDRPGDPVADGARCQRPARRSRRAGRSRCVIASMTGHPWLDPSALRIGLGCMRFSTDENRDEQLAIATIAAAADAGVTVFDTARAYAPDGERLGHNERLLARALVRCGAGADARVVTKGGMARTGGGWIPDGRAKTILATARRAVPRSPAWRSTCTCCTPPTRARRGERRCARWRDSPSRGSSRPAGLTASTSAPAGRAGPGPAARAMPR